MRTLTMSFPPKLVFGNGCRDNFVEDFIALGYKSLLLVTTKHIVAQLDSIIKPLKNASITIGIDESIDQEPTIESLYSVIKQAEKINADSVVGIGGGSVLDVAKLVAAMYKNDQDIHDVFGINKLQGRAIYLACLPTTSGTGSEVSPNAILLDSNDNLKKGAVSPYLVPDATYVDPTLTYSVPPSVTAATGIDALTHCIEAYANKFAHPIISRYALDGIKVIGKNLVNAYKFGENVEARENVALGSMYGGLCLGPVNTAAVHALAYPLGGEFHIPHGISNAVLLPYVMKFNAESFPKPYADIAVTLGAEAGNNDFKTALNGIEIIKKIYLECEVSTKMSKLGIPEDTIERMADAAMTVTRLLKNNLRELTKSDIINIYKEAF